MRETEGVTLGDVTRILHAIQVGQPHAADDLMGMVYEELRKVARAKINLESGCQTLQPTALVHEAWMRLGDGGFENRAHFFAAAAEAMRRILVERARRKRRAKHGAGAEHCAVDGIEIATPVVDDDEILAVNEALDQFSLHEPRMAELVKLRYFAGLTFEETATMLAISVRTAKRDWSYARAWLHREISKGKNPT